MLDTEKREANTGDKIIVTSIKYDKMISKKYRESFVECDVGDIFTVECRFTDSIQTTTKLNLWDYEYLVLKNNQIKVTHL